MRLAWRAGARQEGCLLCLSATRQRSLLSDHTSFLLYEPQRAPKSASRRVRFANVIVPAGSSLVFTLIGGTRLSTRRVILTPSSLCFSWQITTAMTTTTQNKRNKTLRSPDTLSNYLPRSIFLPRISFDALACKSRRSSRLLTPRLVHHRAAAPL